MFSVVFPGQGSQEVGMGKILYEKFDLVKNYFKEADETLNFAISKLVLEGPKSDLDLTFNTQPAIFLISYSIFNVMKKEFNINLNKATFFAGHSLGEYSALSCAGYIKFSDTLKILKIRGEAMQNAVPEGMGGMIAILGTTIKKIEDLILRYNLNKKITLEKIDELGKPVKFDDSYFTKGMIKKFKGCNNSFKCKGDRAGQELYKTFTRSKSFGQKNPGKMMR